MAWYAKTKFYHIAELTTWQIRPCPQTFERVHALYKENSAQARLPHPTVIDWIPFPSIRHQLIRHHAANPHIDQIFCDLVSSYVVEAWMSDVILDAPAVRVYVRVMDLIHSVGKESCEGEAKDVPAPNSEALFASPKCSRALFSYLGMHRGASQYKLDPEFFDKYPDLHDAAAGIIAQGTPLRPPVQLTLTRPLPLNHATFQTYRNFIDFTWDLKSHKLTGKDVS
ncbi:hypothetical protein BFJ69_g15863 [Fusarium oxysporum]|uniref:Uncharacterized protein n=1 Tax=Fusarium oxysporum TaxID=5507 RepID=A0A420MCY5_FUSOX|nr:hypothetical protein BFJ69_g15863 [Fusarium oxysporum]